ncbi:MAG TPA: MerR family transcriptional regulator [Pseudonocardia sp.]|uniref:MerR family transcriptional regulator n=1 Tax=Pseudonocardia sp. TaxID=60912 RepID=UPI002B4B3ABC|nr:MerR family transcriptional regulator [Pseudonocardia sp.]HLU58173.1 MerR family transcriptional regulator [Pseudonocardia sp.]
MNISEAARRTGVAVDTIRYYDRLGLLGAVRRTPGGAREFTEGDLGWLRVLRCLRDTGMRMADLRRFVAIDGDREPARRRELLEAHRAAVLERIERTYRELEVLDGKIAAYRELEQKALEAQQTVAQPV